MTSSASSVTRLSTRSSYQAHRRCRQPARPVHTVTPRTLSELSIPISSPPNPIPSRRHAASVAFPYPTIRFEG
jgi:hypothetical protein